ncbi:MAG TPA: L-histidine N(alpha)-methyltransferase [Actinomycetota bacterium]
MTQAAAVRTDVYLGPDDIPEALRADALAGLTSTPKALPPKWFYDDRGSALFDRITRLPEYYPTRREREILVRRAGEIAASSDADTLIELGSGTSEKTRLLLDAFERAGTLRRFVPFDLSEQTLRDAAAAIASEHPGVEIHAIVGDFERHLEYLPGGGTRMIAFLGGTIGNLEPEQRHRFFSDIRAGMQEGDSLLLGTDLVKDVARLEAAYDDTAGVTAAFNLNVLNVLNRELGGDFDLDLFEHLAFFDQTREWIEMRLRSRREQRVKLRDIDLEVHFAEGEQMRTEISVKFRREGVERELLASGLRLKRWWTDAAGDFALSLAVPG